MKDINFLRAGSGQTHKFAVDGKKTSIPLLIVILLIVIAVGGKLTLMQRNNAVVQEIAEKEAYIAENAIVYEIENNIKDYNVQMNKTVELISRLQKVNVKNSEVFEHLAKGMPDSLFLATYAFGDDRKVLITGEAPTKESVANYTWSLKQLQTFKDVLLNSVTRQVKGDNTGEVFKYDFTVEL